VADIEAEIISVGTELLLGQIVDTDAPAMAQTLAECGIVCRQRVTVGDNHERLVALLRAALKRCQVVITIGGLGPTQDDLTREAVAEAMDDSLETVPEVVESLKEFFASRGVKWTESNAKQAQKPTCATHIPNPNGTAPGILCNKQGKIVVCMPGPPGEFLPMLEHSVGPMLAQIGTGQVIFSKSLRVTGMGESAMEAKILDLLASTNPTIAPYAKVSEVHLRLTARAATKFDALKLIEPVEVAVRKRLGSAVYGCDDETLESVVIGMLTSRGLTVSTAESMTGGGLGKRLTSVGGASAVYVGGIVAYSSQLKTAILGVNKDVLQKHGPVSAEVAQHMAENAKELFKADYAISITGNAGPTSDTDGKPIGRVFVGISGPTTRVHEVNLRGTREDIRNRAEYLALRWLREDLLNLNPNG
jgi:nicotinamide-nucleotide amidase